MFASHHPSVILTQNQLSQALMDLMQDQAFEKISVKSLTDKAGVSRQTFYKNFGTKEAIIHFMLFKRFQETRETFYKYAHDIPSFIKAFFRQCKSEKKLLTLLKDHKKLHLLSDVFTQSLDQSLQINLLTDQVKSDDLIYAYHFLIGAILQVLAHWLDEDMKKDLDDLVKISISLLSGCAFNTIQDNIKA